MIEGGHALGGLRTIAAGRKGQRRSDAIHDFPMEPENSDFAIQARESAIRNSRFESCIASNPQSIRDRPYKTDMNIGILQPLPCAPALPDLPTLSGSE